MPTVALHTTPHPVLSLGLFRDPKPENTSETPHTHVVDKPTTVDQQVARGKTASEIRAIAANMRLIGPTPSRPLCTHKLWEMSRRVLNGTNLNSESADELVVLGPPTPPFAGPSEPCTLIVHVPVASTWRIGRFKALRGGIGEVGGGLPGRESAQGSAGVRQETRRVAVGGTDSRFSSLSRIFLA